MIGGGAITTWCLPISHLVSFHAQWSHLIYLSWLLHFASPHSFISATFTIHHPFLWTSLFTSEWSTRILEMENTHWKHKPFKESIPPPQKRHYITISTNNAWKRYALSISLRMDAYSTNTTTGLESTRLTLHGRVIVRERAVAVLAPVSLHLPVPIKTALLHLLNIVVKITLTIFTAACPDKPPPLSGRCSQKLSRQSPLRKHQRAQKHSPPHRTSRTCCCPEGRVYCMNSISWGTRASFNMCLFTRSE